MTNVCRTACLSWPRCGLNYSQEHASRHDVVCAQLNVHIAVGPLLQDAGGTKARGTSCGHGWPLKPPQCLIGTVSLRLLDPSHITALHVDTAASNGTAAAATAVAALLPHLGLLLCHLATSPPHVDHRFCFVNRGDATSGRCEIRAVFLGLPSVAPYCHFMGGGNGGENGCMQDCAFLVYNGRGAMHGMVAATLRRVCTQLACCIGGDVFWCLSGCWAQQGIDAYFPPPYPQALPAAAPCMIARKQGRDCWGCWVVDAATRSGDDAPCGGLIIIIVALNPLLAGEPGAGWHAQGQHAN